MTSIKRWDNCYYNGQLVEVISVDSDPKAPVQVVVKASPEKAFFVSAYDLLLINAF